MKLHSINHINLKGQDIIRWSERMNEMEREKILKNLTLIQNYVNAWYKPINDEEYRRVYKRVNELLTDTKHKIEELKE